MGRKTERPASREGGLQLRSKDMKKRNYQVSDLSVPEQLRCLAAGILLCLAADYLFFESWYFLIPMIPVPFLVLHAQKNRAIRRRKRTLNYQFREALVSLSVAVRAGYSLENAVCSCTRDLERMFPPDTDIVREFRYMETQMRVSVPADELFSDLGRRSEVEDIMNFAQVLTVCRRMGGDLSDVIHKCSRMVADKIDVHKEIQAEIAAKKAEHTIMSVMPAGIIVYLKLTSPGFLSSLYGSIAGRAVMTVCLAVYAGAWYMGRRIVEIEV